MSLKEQMEQGLMFVEHNHSDPEDARYAEELQLMRDHCREVIFDYNTTRPTHRERKRELLKGLLGSMPSDGVLIESPVNMSYGSNVFLKGRFYANYGMSIVDDMPIYIGNRVMFGPNVTLSATGHPVYTEYRLRGAHFSLPITIGDHVWVGANSVILPGVTIGENTVIGAGSVVTKDIPANVIAMGVPCRVVREIGDHDKEYYHGDKKVNFDFDK